MFSTIQLVDTNSPLGVCMNEYMFYIIVRFPVYSSRSLLVNHQPYYATGASAFFCCFSNWVFTSGWPGYHTDTEDDPECLILHTVSSVLWLQAFRDIHTFYSAGDEDIIRHWTNWALSPPPLMQCFPYQYKIVAAYLAVSYIYFSPSCIYSIQKSLLLLNI